jgi:putative isomerase
MKSFVKNFSLSVVFLLLGTNCIYSQRKQNISFAEQKYNEMQQTLAKGWNTWDTRSVMRHVLLPYGTAVDLNLISSDGERNTDYFIGKRDKDAALLHPGTHTYNGYYTDMVATWSGVSVRVESASEGQSEVIVITPQTNNVKGGKIAITLQSLWKRDNTFKISNEDFTVSSCFDHLNLSGKVFGYIIKQNADEFIMSADEPIIIICGNAFNKEQALSFVKQHKDDIASSVKSKYGDCYDEYNAMQSALGWNTIFDPTINKTITPVARFWSVNQSSNSDLGGFVLFCWDTYFASMMFSVDCKELAYSNAVEITNGITDDGFVPNFRTEYYKTRDRSQPPVGSLAAWTIYSKYKEKWFLELLFDKLMSWNRWWDKSRNTNGLLCWGSSPVKPITYRYWEWGGVNENQGAEYESGLDNSPMYDGISFDAERHQQKLNDVGLNSLYVMDCNMLAKIADVLGHKEEQEELLSRGKKYSENLSRLWDEHDGMYYNMHTDTNKFNYRTSPTNFYPLLVDHPSSKQADKIVKKHLLNPEEFWGQYVIPSTPHNDPAFKDNRWVLIISFFELFVPPEPFMWNTTHFIYCKFNINLS